MLALASLYKFQNPRQAAGFVAESLRSLRVSAQEEVELQQGLQHIVSGILICSYEVSLHLETK
ncbi:hypothetical protein BH09PAT1_BH09PAT1_8720 [soil metagenome]